jgi:hypothetical protein
MRGRMMMTGLAIWHRDLPHQGNLKLGLSISCQFSILFALVAIVFTRVIRFINSFPLLFFNDCNSVAMSGVQAAGSDASSYRNIREIHLHDLRHLEHQFNPHEEPTILIRRHAILISLNPLRAVITADKLMLIVPNGADSLLYMLHEHMHGKEGCGPVSIAL